MGLPEVNESSPSSPVGLLWTLKSSVQTPRIHGTRKTFELNYAGMTLSTHMSLVLCFVMLFFARIRRPVPGT